MKLIKFAYLIQNNKVYFFEFYSKLTKIIKNKYVWISILFLLVYIKSNFLLSQYERSTRSINIGNQYKQVVEIFGRQENYSFDENDFLYFIYDCGLSSHVLVFDKDKMRLRVNAVLSTSPDYNPILLNRHNVTLQGSNDSICEEEIDTFEFGVGSARYIENQCIFSGNGPDDLYKYFVLFNSVYGVQEESYLYNGMLMFDYSYFSMYYSLDLKKQSDNNLVYKTLIKKDFSTVSTILQETNLATNASVLSRPCFNSVKTPFEILLDFFTIRYWSTTLN